MHFAAFLTVLKANCQQKAWFIRFYGSKYILIKLKITIAIAEFNIL